MLTKTRAVLHNVLSFAFCMDWSIMCFKKNTFLPQTWNPKNLQRTNQRLEAVSPRPYFTWRHVKSILCLPFAREFFFNSFISFLKVVELWMTQTCLMWVKGITNLMEVRCQHQVFPFSYFKAQSLWSNGEISRPSWGTAYKINIYFKE